MNMHIVQATDGWELGRWWVGGWGVAAPAALGDEER